MFFRSFFLKVFFFVPAAGLAISLYFSIFELQFAISPKQQSQIGNRKSQITYFLPGAFFLATAALRGPLRVRAFVEVRCPRTGKLLR